MKVDSLAPRLLGAAYLVVIVTSLVSGLVPSSALGAGSLAETLRNAADNDTAIRVGVLFAMVNSAGIVVLATLLYVVLRGYGRAVAVAGLGMWLGEAFFYALGDFGLLALVPLGQDFVKAGSPDPSAYLTQADFLYNGLYGLSGTLLMFFYCAGGLLFYSLFFTSRTIPRLLSGYGLAAVTLATAVVVLELLGAGNLMALLVPILPFELVAGLWLLIKGIPGAGEARPS
jgi:hypothetical protein